MFTREQRSRPSRIHKRIEARQFAAIPAILEGVMSAMSTIGPALGGITSAIGLGKELFGGGGGGGGGAGSSAAAPATTGAAKPATPNISPGDYTNQQEAYYKQMLSGLGMGEAGGGLPPGIQESISRQAALL